MEPKPGFLTTEFWLTLSMVLIQAALLFFLSFQLMCPADEVRFWQLAILFFSCAVAVSVPTCIYSYGRSKVKRVYGLKRVMKG